MFELSTVALTNLTTFGVAVGVLYWRLKLKLKINAIYQNTDIGL
jgi:hypothetical protein